MGLCMLTASLCQSPGRIGQGVISCKSQRQRPRIASIHILDGDSLLHVFYLYRPFLLGEDGVYFARPEGGYRSWVRGRWWYKLAHVCQRWRRLLLGSAAYLGISLVSTYGTPAAGMLTHLPRLPLVLDYFRSLASCGVGPCDHDTCRQPLISKNRSITAKDEEQIILALKHRDRVSRVRLVTKVQKLIVAMDKEYPILEYLIVKTPIGDNSTIFTFPETLRAPRLRHLTLGGFAVPLGSRLLTNAVGLVTLCLFMRHPSTYFHPNTLLQWISFMPQLETLVIRFSLPHEDDVERQLTHTPITTPITLPNLHYFRFEGVSTHSEALLRRISTPRLEKLEFLFFNPLTFFVPPLLQLMDKTENLKFDSARFRFFDKRVSVTLYLRDVETAPLVIAVNCWPPNLQGSSMAQISNSHGQVFSAVEHLTLEHETYIRSSGGHNEVDRSEWRQILKPFSSVKTLQIAKGLVEAVSRCLRLEDGELPLELLPELQEIIISRGDKNSGALTAFINARKAAGRAVTLVRQKIK